MEGGAPHKTWHWLWDAYITGMCGTAIIAIVLLEDRIPGRSSTAAAVALAGLAAWLTIAGRQVPRMRPLGARSICYVAIAVLLWALAVWLSPVAVAAIPAMYPIVFSTLPLTAALGVAVAVTLVPLSFELATSGLNSPDLPITLAMTVMGLIAGPTVGIMIVTVVKQWFEMAAVVAELEASRAETSRLSRETGIIAERERLAREIHDTLAQGFTSIVTLAQAVQAEVETDPEAATRHVELIRRTARANLSEARTMVSSLTPAALAADTLAAAIRRQCDAFAEVAGVPVTVSTGRNLPPSTMASNVVLLRATQESLANIRKHADATAVRVDLTADAAVLRLSLSDNGVGLDGDHRDGYGLTGLRSRAAQIGGALTLTPTPGGGVTVVVEVPA